MDNSNIHIYRVRNVMPWNQVSFEPPLHSIFRVLLSSSVGDGQLGGAAGGLSPGQAPRQPQSGPRVIFIFNVPH